MDALLETRGLSKHFPLGGGRRLAALHDVSLSLAPGETLGVVGESGCGKSTLARTLMGVLQPTAGQVLCRGVPLDLRSRRARLAYAKEVQMVFQDPYASLDPRMTVEAIITENLELHGMGGPAQRRARVEALLELVGLSRDHARRFPHEFSGGQRQRVGIARALAVEPKCVICDEPISALDLSVQSQVVNLLRDLQARLGLSYLFIAHDLNMVRYLSHRVAVLYLGSVAELGPADAVCSDPLHPYTRLLLSAVLSPRPEPGRLAAWQGFGEVASPVFPRAGCPFAGRCPQADERCRREEPKLRPVGPERQVACHRV